jgi:uncharacterized protein YjiS (DUF1127 family)
MSITASPAASYPPLLPSGFQAAPQGNSWRSVLASWRLAHGWAERRRQRIALRELAGMRHLLDDLGLTRTQALTEAAKPFWKA